MRERKLKEVLDTRSAAVTADTLPKTETSDTYPNAYVSLKLGTVRGPGWLETTFRHDVLRVTG